MVKLMKFTKVCGRFLVRMLQAKKQAVPQKNTKIFQGYMLGPIAFNVCPVMIRGAPVHCRMSLVSNFFIASIIYSIVWFVNQNFACVYGRLSV